MMQTVVLSLLLVGASAVGSEFLEEAKEKLNLLKKKEHLEEKKPSPMNEVKLGWSNSKGKDEGAISNEKLTQQEIEKRNAEFTTGPQKDVGKVEDYMDFWYVNLKDSTDRRSCMDKQIEEMGFKAHRFAAYSFKRCQAVDQDDIVTCLTQKKYGDCVKSGVNFYGISTHGSQSNEAHDRQYHIVSNWCSHKRMLQKMLKNHREQNSTKKYAVVLEDDVAFDRKEFVRKVVNFCETYDGKYNQTWQMVQIDPFGSKCDKHIVGKFEGLPVWKPRNVNMGWECSNYWGAQALLVKYDAIPDIIKHMEDHPTVPLDWLPAHLPAGLAWRANIALNPEASRSVHMRVPMPRYCEKSVKHSTIGSFRQKSTARAMAFAQTSGANPLDAAKVVVDPDDAEFAELVDKYNAYNPEGTYAEWMDMKEKARADLAKYGIQ